MSPIAGREEHGVTVSVAIVGVCAVPQELQHDICLPGLGSFVKRGRLVIAHCVGICAIFEEEADKAEGAPSCDSLEGMSERVAVSLGCPVGFLREDVADSCLVGLCCRAKQAEVTLVRRAAGNAHCLPDEA